MNAPMELQHQRYDDQRKSTSKALPSPPTTPKRVTHKFRFSAVVVVALAVVTFVLTILIVLGGKQPGYLRDEYMFALNTSHVGRDIIRFERASSRTSATPSATSSPSSNPLDPLNPFSTASPLNPNNPDSPLHNLTSALDPILGNLTDIVDSGLEDAISRIIRAIVHTAGVKDFYYLYLSKECEGDVANSTGRNGDGVKVDKCSSYDDVSTGLNAITSNIQSSVVIGTTNISVPLIAQLSHSAHTLISSLTILRHVILAFFIITLISSCLIALLSLSSIFFSSRLLVYTLLFFSSLAASSAFLTAILLTALIGIVAQAIGGLGHAVSLYIEKGERVIAFSWVAWVCMLMANVYWGAVWFVEVRRWSFVRRRRGGAEVGNWRGIGREVWRDLKGKKGL